MIIIITTTIMILAVLPVATPDIILNISSYKLRYVGIPNQGYLTVKLYKIY